MGKDTSKGMSKYEIGRLEDMHIKTVENKRISGDTIASLLEGSLGPNSSDAFMETILALYDSSFPEQTLSDALDLDKREKKKVETRVHTSSQDLKYCTDCKYLADDTYDLICEHPSNLRTWSNPLHSLEAPMRDIDVLNRDNDCSNYSPSMLTRIIKRLITLMIK